MKSDSTEWVQLSNQWYNDVYLKNIDALYEALEEAKKAVKTVSAEGGDIGSLSLSVTMGELEDLNEKRRRLVSFCNGIHYEMSELVDNPFCVGISDTAQEAYGLDPSDMRVETGAFLFFPLYTSLVDLVGGVITDEGLRIDFENKCLGLDGDEPSDSLKEAFKEAVFWEGEFKKSAECQRIAGALFTAQVRRDWPTMTADERKLVIEDYVSQIGTALKEGRNWWEKLWGTDTSIVTEVRYDYYKGYGSSLSRETTIRINPDFINIATANYSVDKVMDTLTHETRHQYQRHAIDDLEAYGIPNSLVVEWRKPPVSPKDYFNYYRSEKERDARAFAALSRPVY